MLDSSVPNGFCGIEHIADDNYTVLGWQKKKCSDKDH